MMTALSISTTVPLGDAGQVHFAAEVPDIAALSGPQRVILAETAREFIQFAAVTLAPELAFEPDLPPGPELDEARAGLQDKPAAAVHDPHGSVLDGVRGTRANTS